jgi:hypothetical protein
MMYHACISFIQRFTGTVILVRHDLDADQSGYTALLIMSLMLVKG